MSDAPREVEIKFLVHTPSTLVRLLHESGFHERTPSTFESNTLYDTPEGDLRRSGEILRLRQYGQRWVLTHKAKADEGGRHKSRVEQETEVADGQRMHAILTALGYLPAFRYEKYRAEYSDGQGEVVVDRTPIGHLAEIEGPPEWIDRTAAALGVAPGDYITASYAALFFRWKQRTGSLAMNMTFEECAQVAGVKPRS